MVLSEEHKSVIEHRGDKLASLEIKMAVIETEIKGINHSIEEHKNEQRKDFDLVFEKLDKLGGTFAGKWVEKLSIGLLISIIGAIFVFIISNLP